MTQRGKFIVEVGGEGSGKGVVGTHLREIYKEKNIFFTREPGGTVLSEKIRHILINDRMTVKAEMLLFEAARAEHVETFIEPALASGTHVFSDRFDACTYAYQLHARKNKVHAEHFFHINDWVVGVTVPDLYIFCDVEPKTALARRMSAGGELSKFDKEQLDFHNAVYEGYKEFLKDKRCVNLDTSRPVEKVLKEIEAIMQRELGF